MKAMVLNAPNSVAYEDVGLPGKDASEVLIKVTHTGMCGTDLKIYQGGIPVGYPLIMGHESVGEVAGDSNGFNADTKVIVDPALSCGACYNCRAGQPNICPNGGLIGRDRNGGFAEYLTAPAGNVFALPEEVSGDEAPLIQPMTTCLHAQRLARIIPGEAVIVMGLGVTGLLHIQLAKAHGAYPVIGITRSGWKRELAEKLGADFTFAPDDTMLKRVQSITEGRGADVVIESVGKLSVLSQAIQLARLGGRIVPFGIYTEKEGSLPFYDLYFKELAVVNARVAKAEDYPACIDFVKRGVVQLKPLISHTLGLDEMNKALEMLDSGDSNRMKIILDHTRL
ncbi:zinc-binding dehydrogenase [Pseudomonadota bacterium]